MLPASTSVPQPEYRLQAEVVQGLQPRSHDPFFHGKKGFAGLKALVDFRLKPVLRRDCNHHAAPVPNHPARRPDTSSRYSNRKVGRAVPVTPLRGVTGEPHTGHGTANPAQYATYPPLRELPQSGADIPVCARPRGQAGMSATHYHAPSLRLAETASPHLRLRAFARASPALDDRRRHPTTINHNRHRLASGRQAPSSMTISRPFRASLFSPRYPGRCPGLVCFAPSGLPRVARTFLSARVYEGRQECLPHTSLRHHQPPHL